MRRDQGSGIRGGFTILELMVASLLLTMLVTMLTMIFNQSSVAWQVGVDSVRKLDDTRMLIGAFHDIEDDALPGLAQDNVQYGSSDNRKIKYRTVSVFKGWDGKGPLRNNAERYNSSCKGRAFDEINWGRVDSIENRIADAANGASSSISGASGSSGSPGSNGGANQSGVSAGGFYLVGMWSAGPDRKWDTDDDINTFPEDIE